MPQINLGNVRPKGGTGDANIKVVDIGSAEFDPSQLDFSGYSAGDVVLVVKDMSQ